MKLVQVDSTHIINPEHIEYISKISDTKVVIHFTSGSSFYAYCSMSEINSKLNGTTEFLSETCA